MQFKFAEFITDPFVLMFISVVTGLLLGEIKFGRFNLGSSGGLFTGLGIGWFIHKTYAIPYASAGDAAPKYAQTILKGGVVPKDFFTFTLLLFVTAVGLLAAKDVGRVVKKYGGKFIFLGFLVTFAGAVATYLMTKVSPGQDPFAVSGVYTGALTSSPGLAAAIEGVSKYGKEAEAAVGYGHAVGYAPGVLIVIIAMQFFPMIFGINLDKEKAKYLEEMGNQKEEKTDSNIKEVSLDIVAFFFAAIVGYFIGSIEIYLGPQLKYFSLGSTGGVLIAALVFGHIGQIGPLHFRMNSKILGAIREVSLCLFLAIVGLRYGYETVISLTGTGAYLALVSFVCGTVALLIGFAVGRYVFKLNWIILSGALCGGMTSTPGLGAAIDAAKSDDVAAGYGATYPFALIGMVLFTILLHKIV